MSEIQKQLSSVKGGRVSLAEAIRQLDVAKEAFSMMDSIDHRLEAQESLLTQLKNEHSKLIPMGYFQTKYKELSSNIDLKIKDSIDKFSKRWESTLKNKIDHHDLAHYLDSKANWTAIHDINQEISMIKGLMDQHFNIEFPNFKTQVKLKFKDFKVPEQRTELNLQIENVGNQQVSSKHHIFEEEKTQEKPERKNSHRPNKLVKPHKQKEEPVPQDKQSSENTSNVHDITMQNSKDIQTLQRAIDDLTAKTKGMIHALDRIEHPAKASTPSKNYSYNTESKIQEKGIETLKRGLEEKDKKAMHLEKKLKKVIEETNLINSNTREFIAESLQNVQKVSQIKQEVMSEITRCGGLIRFLEDSTNSKLASLKKTLEEFRGPFRDLVFNQQKQLDALTEDIRRHQDISRSIVEEYTHNKNFISPEQGITSRKTINTRDLRSRSITPSDQIFKPARSFYSREQLKLPRYSIKQKSMDI